jgi:hypothetical protein
VCALIIAFNRFHNYVVKELAIINEHGRFSLPPGVNRDHPDYDKAQEKRDNDLFQTGRLYVARRKSSPAAKSNFVLNCPAASHAVST